jgi:hypothetical protein
MSARIYSPAKSAMQSGKARTGHWILEFAPSERKTIEPLMGYTSSADTRSQVRLRFDTLEAAIAYAERHGIEYHLQKPKEPRRRPVSYADNFRHDRRIPWTH